MSLILYAAGLEAVKQRLATTYMDTTKMLADIQDLVTTVETLQARLQDIQAAAQ